VEAFVTLGDRKKARVGAMRRGFLLLCDSLSDYARAHGGRYIAFGSAASGDLRFDSDVDILVDFPDAMSTSSAWRFAEDECWRLDLTPDVRPVAYCEPPFVSKALETGTILA